MIVSRIDDLKSSLLLSGAFGISAAITVPLLLPTMPVEARGLPLPLPIFCGVLATQLFLLYGLFGYTGLRMARTRGLEPEPYLTAMWSPSAEKPRWDRAGLALCVGLACGVLLVACVSVIDRFFPATLPKTLHPPGVVASLSASVSGSLGEEILFRLFLLSLMLRLVPNGTAGVAAAVGVSALAFATAHTPAMVFLFGGWHAVPSVSWLWLIALNGTLGMIYGMVFIRLGIVCAVLAHLGTNLIWHVASSF